MLENLTGAGPAADRAAPMIVVVDIDLRILGELLLAQHNAVLDVDAERAVADAVDAVRGAMLFRFLRIAGLAQAPRIPVAAAPSAVTANPVRGYPFQRRQVEAFLGQVAGREVHHPHVSSRHLAVHHIHVEHIEAALVLLEAR